MLSLVDFYPVQIQQPVFPSDAEEEAEFECGELDQTVYEKPSPMKSHIPNSPENKHDRNKISETLYSSPIGQQNVNVKPNRIIKRKINTESRFETPRSYYPTPSANVNSLGATYTLAGGHITPPLPPTSLFTPIQFSTQRGSDLYANVHFGDMPTYSSTKFSATTNQRQNFSSNFPASTPLTHKQGQGYPERRNRRFLPSPPQSPTFARRRVLPAIPITEPVRERPYTRPVVLPKSLKYDGTTNWQAFYTKFTKFAQASNWSIDECRNQFCWCLEGKASEFYAMLADRKQDENYVDLIRKFEKRFGFQDLPETLQMQFLSARQKPSESIEDWADRVVSLATKAFRDLPDDHMYSQAILRFCQGSIDKDAGTNAATSRPQSIEDAVDKVKWYKHTVKAIYGRSSKTREVLSDSDSEGSPVRVQAARPQKTDYGQSTELQKQMTTLVSSMQQLTTEMATMKKQLNESSRPTRSRFPDRGRGRRCYNCDETGHFKRNCPKLKDKDKSKTEKKNVSQPENESLNQTGLAQEA